MPCATARLHSASARTTSKDFFMLPPWNQMRCALSWNGLYSRVRHGPKKKRRQDAAATAGVAGATRLCADERGFLYAIDIEPRRRRFEARVHVLDVLHAFTLQPLAKGVATLLCVDGDAVFPGGASAEHAVELHAGLGRELERFGE